jgi:hypothetical protein
MGFATSWLEKRTLFPAFIRELPDKQTGIIVVIPAYGEPGIIYLLDSLASCEKPRCMVEIIIIVNAPPDAPPGYLTINRELAADVEEWKNRNQSRFFRLYLIDAGQPSIRHWGVGLARKTGMDEAVRRFDMINMPGGSIVSLDADCTVEKNYFTAICSELLERENRQACSIYFEHPLTGCIYPEPLVHNIIRYELHLRYLIRGLVFAGYPLAFHAIGSAIAFKALNYIKVGGMNRKQGGEDFYLVQKLVQRGGYFTLNSTTVFPSPRESDRVPFGTGPVMSLLMEKESAGFKTYNIDSFKELRMLFGIIGGLFYSTPDRVRDRYNELPHALRLFINENEWMEKINEIKHNTSSGESFHKRFLSWFNMFRIVKYLNLAHASIFEKQPVAEAASTLLSATGFKTGSGSPLDLLTLYRNIEKGNIAR